MISILELKRDNGDVYVDFWLLRGAAHGLGLLIDPAERGSLVADKLLFLEPETDLLLGALDAVRPVADVAAHIQGVVAWVQGVSLAT